MAERLTLKKLSEELETLRTRMQELEQRLEHKIEAGLEHAQRTPLSGTGSTTPAGHPSGIDAEHRQRLIAEEAYMMAERRGFQGGDPARDWAEAERLVDYRLLQTGQPEQPAIQTTKPRKKAARPAKKPATVKKAAAKVSRPAKS